MDRKARAIAGAAALFVLGLAIGRAPALRAEYDNIKNFDLSLMVNAQTIAANGTFTQLFPFTALSRTTNQAVQVKGIGTSPNYKVELLVTLDGTNFIKPEIGGDLGTYTDQNLHIIPLYVPISIGHELKFTELGGAHSVTVTGWEASQ